MRSDKALGPSGRLRNALVRNGHSSNPSDLIDLFEREFDMQATAARKILNQDHIPRESTRKLIAETAGISEAYWMFGFDEFTEAMFIDSAEKTLEIVISTFMDAGLKLSDFPPRLIPHLFSTVYQDARSKDGEPDPEYARKVLEMTLSLAETATSTES